MTDDRRMGRIAIVTNILVAIALTAIVAVLAAVDRRTTIDLAFRSAENLADALSEHTRQTFSALDLGVTSIAEGITEADFQGAESRRRLHDLLLTRQQASTATFAYFILDADGNLVATSRTPDPAPVDLSGIPGFQEQQVNADGDVFLGPPRLGQVGSAEGRWIVNFTRGIQNDDGAFAGMVAATLSIDYLLEFYNTLQVGEDGVVGLLNASGILIARSPFFETHLGRDYSQMPIFSQTIPRDESVREIMEYPFDGGVRLTAYRQVAHNGPEDGPVVFVGLGWNEALAAWTRRVGALAGFAILTMAFFAGTSATLVKHASNRRALELSRSKKLRLLAEESARLVKQQSIEDLLAHVARTAATLIGTHQSVASLLRDGSSDHISHGICLSDKYAHWRGYKEKPDGSGIYRLVTDHNRAIFLTQTQLEQHPDWKGFGQYKDRHPPLKGWLAVPIIGQDGRNIGLIQLSDKEHGDFDEDDVNQVSQLASITAVAIENLQAIQLRETALDEARAAQAEIETIFASISDAVWALDRDWRFVYMNAAAARMLNSNQPRPIGQSIWSIFPELSRSKLHEEFLRARSQRTAVSFEFHHPSLKAWFGVRAFPHDDGLTAYLQDDTRRVEAEDRLRQSQKMEAIGQLTGGIAHDFNNQLTVILGNADSLVDHLADAPAPILNQAVTIQRAGERAAELTHRLLAFARRQPLDPRTININDLVASLENILRRTLGEDIDIEMVRGGGLWKAVVDPGELENAILNLALNARDAMPDGGKLTIETANIAVDARYAEDHEMDTGHYVMLAVSDTGHGMSEETADRAFDPFFTTKKLGKGSGLGLSMVYGFARQTGGNARIYSEVGEGTTVRVYLPRSDNDAITEVQRSKDKPVIGGTERILVVEDDDLVREHTVNCLQSLGYAVVDVSNGAEATALIEQSLSTDQSDRFNLLLTDVVLTGSMSGKDVAETAASLDPALKVLFMSGYTENAIVHHGRLDRGVHLLGKPFRIADLARKVREVIDAA